MTDNEGGARIAFIVGSILAVVVCVVCVTACSGATIKAHILHESVALVPDMAAGEVGWCVTNVVKGGCAQPGRLPVVAENWSRSESKSAAGEHKMVMEGMVVTTSRVISVSVDRVTLASRHSPQLKFEPWSVVGDISTSREAGLPDQLRAAAVRITGVAAPHAPNGELDFIPVFVPLNRAGKTVSEMKRNILLNRRLPTQKLNDAVRPETGVCRIELEHIRGVLAFGAEGIDRVVPQRGFIGHAFMSCASTLYKIGGWRLEASVLLNAAQPGTRPSGLPLMKLLGDRTGIVETLSSGEAAVARRVSHGWLVVRGGRNRSEQLLLLEDLRVSMHM